MAGRRKKNVPDNPTWKKKSTVQDNPTGRKKTSKQKKTVQDNSMTD